MTAKQRTDAPTPRTDKVAGNLYSDLVRAQDFERLAEHARTLERENTALREALTACLDHLYDSGTNGASQAIAAARAALSTSKEDK